MSEFKHLSVRRSAKQFVDGMGRAYSDDLRERVAAAVLSGRSFREVAALFSVSVASAVKWSQRLRQTGSAAAKPQGRQQPRSLAPHRDWILGRLAQERDLRMRALVIELGERGIVIMDNLGSHKSPAVRKALREVGAKLLFLPPYSPDLNPIEQVFAKLKTLLSKTAERTVEATWKRIATLLNEFKSDECASYLRNSGYASN
jgi:transposase/transposase-like protein